MRTQVFLLMALLALGCSRSKMGEMERAKDARYPGAAATHVVELRKVQIADADFGTTRNGNPLDIRVLLMEDGREIPSTVDNKMSGLRGKHSLEYPVTWTVNFDPAKRYQVFVQEQAVNTEAHEWSIPKEPRAGYWPIATEAGHIAFGKESWLEFKDKVE